MMLKQLFTIAISFTCAISSAQSPLHILPQPIQAERRPGEFRIDAGTSITVSGGGNGDRAGDAGKADRVVNFFREQVTRLSGIRLPVRKAPAPGRHIEFVLGDTTGLGDEGYRIAATTTLVRVSAGSVKGLFYGVETLLQTLPFIRTNQPPAIPCMEVMDRPRCPWRGMMLDVSRHFFSPDMVKEFIDVLASYKMNVFHWHLVDGAGWRLEIKKYPKLTSLAAWRVDDRDKPWNWGEVMFNADKSRATYGGYYTQEQVKDIVAYAAARNITIVPEIEMPGHSEIAMAAYPQLSCHPRDHFGNKGDFLATHVESNYCPGNDSSFVFLQDVLTEVMQLFPSTYIHLGGDEVDKTDWKTCDKCQRRMNQEGLKNVEELQSYFMKRMEKFLLIHHRRMIGWDEILEGGLAPSATVMSWRGEDGGIQAAKMGHDVVMTPGDPCYFDHYQGDPATEPLAIGGFNTLKRVYDYEPVPQALDASQALHVLGSQANLWTEYISTWEHAEYMILPRILALSEVLWSPVDRRNWQDFNIRLQPHLRGFEERGLHYCKGNYKVEIKPLVKDGKLFVGMATENPDGVIYYSIDGSMPGVSSLRYEHPIAVTGTMRVKAVMTLQGKVMNPAPAEQSFTLNKATGREVVYLHPNSRYYPADGPNTLTDGIRGTTDIGRGWHAFSGEDLVATIDLGSSMEIGRLSLGCIQNWGQWIFLPSQVRFELSDDGVHFREAGVADNNVPMDLRDAVIKDFIITIPKQQARYVRVTARNAGPCPKGHPGEGQNSWIFADEVIVE